MPYATPVGPTYDCGDFPRMLARALDLADYGGLRAPPRGGRGAGTPAGTRPRVLRGVVGGGPVAAGRRAGRPARGFFEAAEVRVDPEGAVLALVGTHSHGQGHATTFAQILASRLGVPLDRIEIVEGDTDRVPYGTGTFGSRSIAVGGSALDRAAAKIVVEGAADRGAPPGSGGGRPRVPRRRVRGRRHPAGASGSPRWPGPPTSPTSTPPTSSPGSTRSPSTIPPNFAFSNGAHVCEVEVDPETGEVRVVDYRVVDDVGTVINPLVVEGQVHGGLAQGIGQALAETTVYDGDSGQLLSGSLLDYAVPRADDLPDFVTETDESQPCTHNPLGAKGCGESGTIGAPPAVMSAVLDALAPLGVADLDMPATPERVWRAIQAAKAAGRPLTTFFRDFLASPFFCRVLLTIRAATSFWRPR